MGLFTIVELNIQFLRVYTSVCRCEVVYPSPSLIASQLVSARTTRCMVATTPTSLLRRTFHHHQHSQKLFLVFTATLLPHGNAILGHRCLPRQQPDNAARTFAEVGFCCTCWYPSTWMLCLIPKRTETSASATDPVGWGSRAVSLQQLNDSITAALE
jgi:hypothetical protein